LLVIESALLSVNLWRYEIECWINRSTLIPHTKGCRNRKLIFAIMSSHLFGSGYRSSWSNHSQFRAIKPVCQRPHHWGHKHSCYRRYYCNSNSWFINLSRSDWSNEDLQPAIYFSTVILFVSNRRRIPYAHYIETTDWRFHPFVFISRPRTHEKTELNI
jgi:hypothetical protein